MLKYLLLLFFPFTAIAQKQKAVEPVLSVDYRKLINQQKVNPVIFVNDTATNISQSKLRMKGYYYPSLPVKNISIDNGILNILSGKNQRLLLGINYTTGITFKDANNTVKLQDAYVQGRPQNGSPAWRGPETGEMFSYGPAINTLEFDGSAYSYDVNGRLVPKGTGSGTAAKVYDNNIFRTGSTYSNDLKLTARLIRDYNKEWNFNMRYMQQDEKFYIQENKNRTRLFSAGTGAVIRNNIFINAGYSYLHDDFANDNRHGFLNRTYQNALLTPVSFSNSQGTQTGTGQRSYSKTADNPLFLLRNPGNHFSRYQHNASLSFEKRYGDLKMSLLQSLEAENELSLESYQPASASFPAGIATAIDRRNINYFLKANAEYRLSTDNYDWRSSVIANYIFASNRSEISYNNPLQDYLYKRSSHHLSLNFSCYHYSNYKREWGFNAGNKFYISNTASSNSYFLPFAEAYIKLYPPDRKMNVKFASTFNRSKSELPINQSYTQAMLMHYTAADALQYFPDREVTGFKDLKPTDNSEATARIELWYDNVVSFNAEAFIKNMRDAVYPVYENNSILLKNIAGTQTKGMEFTLGKLPKTFNEKKITVNSAISYTFFTNRVTRIADGYNFTPIAGFSNVYKALVKGQTAGSIVGSSYLRDANNNIMIGADGFPLADVTPKIIGDPTPDFVMKLSNIVRYKKWSLNMDLEWQKGGDVWNGTQAALDYYGRSEQSGTLRNTTGYIFKGTAPNGRPNTTPADFYNPSLPLEANRWVRYGVSGIAEEYIQQADHIRINALTLSYSKPIRKYMRQLTVTAFVSNLLIWTAYEGTGNDQPMYGQSNTTGLNFFNLPSYKTYGLTLSLQF